MAGFNAATDESRIGYMALAFGGTTLHIVHIVQIIQIIRIIPFIPIVRIAKISIPVLLNCT